MSAALAVLLKAPRMGTVKTRLASEIGARQALRLYRVMVARTLASVGEASLEVTVWFTPSEAAAEVRFWLGAAWDLRPQASGDLGARLFAAEQAVARGRPWIAIGVDCPRLTGELLQEAVGIIRRGSVVLGPATDGGYYLIGGTTPLPGLFSDMPWGTDRVLSETRARLKRAGARWQELPELRDVDTAEAARAEGLLT
ncbi:MAG TPA: TIGR04282 family arsenosugar biosynthesis glycosyltransferase [Gemmatimonadales bacterium]|jgi:rSAM/selenodomain-associated transferase 1|nr:TIGR04282 family arsenosugar biosynthesis glycosyltransferase [Gemmatimonadales bacterium]